MTYASGGSDIMNRTSAHPQVSYSSILRQGVATLQKAVTEIESMQSEQMKKLQDHKKALDQSYMEKVALLKEEHAAKISDLEQREQQLQTERRAIEKEKQHLLQAQIDVDKIADHQNPITLEIGGDKFRTQIGTLMKYKDSIFPRLVKTLQERSPGKSPGSIFIDRDSKHFKFILNFLRQGEEVIRGSALHSKPVDDYVLNEIIAEAHFYKLPELERLVKTSIQQSSKK